MQPRRQATLRQPIQCDLQPEIPKHPITTHTQPHPKQLAATVTMRPKKKRQTDRSRNRRTHEVPVIVPCSHFTRKNTAPASSPKQSSCNIHAAITMRFAASTRKLAPIYAQNNTRTADDKSHAAIPMRSATGDSKTASNYAHTTTPKAASSHRYTAAKKKRQTDRSRTRRTDEVPFIVACSHFTRKNTRFRAPASSPKHSPCNIMQPSQCDLQPEIPKQPLTTHAQPHPKQLQATVTMRQKKTTNRPQPHPSHRRGTFHRRLPLYTEKRKVSCSSFLPKT